MFLGGAGLADTMLYCRDKIYPLGPAQRPRARDHRVRVLMKMFLGLKASFLPPDPSPLSVSVSRGRRTIQRTLLAARGDDARKAAARRASSVARRDGRAQAARRRGAADVAARAVSRRALRASSAGRRSRGVHFEEADEITIEGESSNVILDGETFRAERGRPIHLRPAQPLSFVKLAA